MTALIVAVLVPEAYGEACDSKIISVYPTHWHMDQIKPMQIQSTPSREWRGSVVIDMAGIIIVRPLLANIQTSKGKLSWDLDVIPIPIPGPCHHDLFLINTIVSREST